MLNDQQKVQKNSNTQLKMEKIKIKKIKKGKKIDSSTREGT